MLGIDARFRGQPADSDWRYSGQLLSHLIAEALRTAREWSDADNKPQWLVLMVHQDNARAIKFYEQRGFELIPGVLRRKDHSVMKLWIGE
jgi:ribosomal protein S18 acetylase RimI-like enzyme